jgi:hypothetical protein
MASVESQKPACPVCHQSDEVKTMQAAFDSGVVRAAPPDMPTRNVSMMPTILSCVILVALCVFFIIVLIGSESDIGIVPELILIGVTLISIVTALVLSYVAFQRVVSGDNEATLRFPTWDRAVAAWKKLYYCSRDDVVFDPEKNQVVSEETLAALRSMEESKAEQIATTLVQK